MHCSLCQSSVGDDVKVQPTTVDGERFCPRCFVFRRVHAEPERFNASQMAAVHCQLCGWDSVSFGVHPMRFQAARCNHCLQYSAMILPIELMPLTKKEASTIEEIARESGIKDPKRLTKRA